MRDAGERAGERGSLAVQAGLFALAVAIRALPVPTVFVDGRIQPFGGDAFYHLRRIAYAVAHFPSALGFDPYLAFPDGAKPIWTPTLDWAIAAVAVVFGAEPASPEMERIAVWVPPLLGGATVVALYRWARPLYGESVARIGAALLCAMSGHFWYSQLGFVDHHAAVAWVTTILAGCTARALDAAQRGQTVPVLPVGLVLGAALWVWPGALLHVGVALGALVALLFVAPNAEIAAAWARRLAGIGLVAFAILLPAAFDSWPQWGDYSPVVASRFQPLLFAGLAAWAAIVSLWWRRDGSSRRGRLLSGAAVAAVLLGVFLVAVPELRVGAADAWRWFGKREEFQSLVIESSPLLRQRGEPTFDIAFGRLSYFFALAPVAWLAAAWQLRCEPRAASRWFFLVWTAVLLAATLVQRRFFNTSSIALALLMGWSIRSLYGWSKHRWGGDRRADRAAAFACGLGTLVLMTPVLATYYAHVANWWRGDSVPVASQVLLEQRVGVQLALYLKGTSEPTSGWLDAGVAPEYAVLAPWPLGHLLEYVARRPTLGDGFGDDIGESAFAQAQKLFRSREAEAIETLRARSVRYVIVQRSAAFLGGESRPDSLLVHLFRRDGSADGGVRAVEHHRLVYESSPLGPPGAGGESVYKLFEVVTGARITGRAAPGADVEVRIRLVTNRLREVAFASRARADSTGRYQVRVPYASNTQAGVVRAMGSYRVRVGTDERELDVSEQTIATGSDVVGPDFTRTQGG